MHYQLQVVPVEVELHSKRLNSSFYHKKNKKKKHERNFTQTAKHKIMKNDSISQKNNYQKKLL